MTLATGRYEIARRILLRVRRDASIRECCRTGFPMRARLPEYNTVDATLWFFEAIRAYIAYTGEIDFVREHLYPVMKASSSGTAARVTVYVSTATAAARGRARRPTHLDGLEDRRLGGDTRHGKPVEIQALWYNALRIQESLARHAAESEAERQLLRSPIRPEASFNQQFWNAAEAASMT